MTSLYIEPFSGLAGDMFLSALCELSDAHEEITALPKALGVNAKVIINELNKNGIACKHTKVIDLSNNEASSHTNLSTINAIIDDGEISDACKQTAKAIFAILCAAEAKVHNSSVEHVHLHELSAADSVIDIVGCAYLLDKLAITNSYCEPICTGYGSVSTQHGDLPIPAPATAELLSGMPVYKGEQPGERVTPTGAAILKYLDPIFSVPLLKTTRIGYGPGEQDFAIANVLRLSLVNIEDAKLPALETYIVETNIDDMPAEYLGDSFQRGLLENGALDYTLTPTLMKKGRPAYVLSVLVNATTLAEISDFILEQTTSIGLRYYPANRVVLERATMTHNSEYGPITIKSVTTPSGKKRYKIEQETIARVSREQKLSLQETNDLLRNIIEKQQTET